MSRAKWGGLTRAHARRMATLMAAGVGIFVALLGALNVALVLARVSLDQTFYVFYPMMAAIGAVFGFERWWAVEQGDYNPFHDS